MIGILSTILMIIVFFFSGKLFESIKRALTLILNLIMRALRLAKINVGNKEKHIKLSTEFKTTFGDIRIMMKSKQNLKMKKSVNVTALVAFILSTTLIILNLDAISGNMISVWLFEHNLFPLLIITQSNMDITFTAVVFSVLSFSSSTLYKQWMDTKETRVAKKQIRQKRRLMNLMTSKEMLDLSRQKDSEKLQEVLPQIEEGQENV